jgi:transcriptional regulator with XRE-family HTH domain
MKLFNIAHFHRSRLRRLIEPTRALGSIMISGAQIRAARGLLCWTRHELARRAVVSDATVYGLQTARGSAANPSTLAAVQATLEAAGIDFLMALRRGCGYIPDGFQQQEELPNAGTSKVSGSASTSKAKY